MSALQDNLLQDILHTDPDRALKEAMASKQATNAMPVDREPRMSTMPDPMLNNDNMSESNFSSRTAPEFPIPQNDHVFKMPQLPVNPHSRIKKQLTQEFNNICKQIDKWPSADFYYEQFLKRIKSFHLRATADVLDHSSSQYAPPNGFLANTMMDCSSAASHCSNSRGFQGFQGSNICNNMLNESIRSANSLINNRSHVVSSTTYTPPENMNSGAFLAPKAGAMNPPNFQAGPSATNIQDMQETVRSADSAANTTQAGGGSFLARTTVSAPVCAPNRVVENIRKSKEKNPSPLAKSSPVNNSVVENSPINMNSTVDSTMNKSRAVNSTFSQRRQSTGTEVTLRNWTLRLDRSQRTREPVLLLRGTIAKKCAVGNQNEPHESRAVKCRITQSCVKTTDGNIYHLQGHFQNHSNEVPKLVTSFYMKNRTFPVHWRKMLMAWSSAGTKAVAEKELPESPAQDSPLNSTMTRMKARERAKVKKTMSPPQQPVLKPLGKPVVNPVNKPLAKPFSKPVANPVSRPIVNPVGRPVVNPVGKPKSSRDVSYISHKHATARRKYETSAMDSSVDSPVEVKAKKKPRQRLVPDSSVNSPAEVRVKKKSRQPPPAAFNSSANSSIDVKAKKKRQPAPRYWNENDISVSETDQSQANFADSSNVSFKVVSPGKALHNIKKMKDSNIINSQVTPPTAYFLNVMSKSSEKKSEKIERTKKPLKRLADRVLKKGKTSANVQNIRQSISTKNPKAIKEFIKESEVRLTKIPVKSRSQMDDEMSDFSDLISEYSDD